MKACEPVPVELVVFITLKLLPAVKRQETKYAEPGEVVILLLNPVQVCKICLITHIWTSSECNEPESEFHELEADKLMNAHELRYGK